MEENKEHWLVKGGNKKTLANNPKQQKKTELFLSNS